MEWGKPAWIVPLNSTGAETATSTIGRAIIARYLKGVRLVPCSAHDGLVEAITAHAVSLVSVCE